MQQRTFSQGIRANQRGLAGAIRTRHDRSQERTLSKLINTVAPGAASSATRSNTASPFTAFTKTCAIRRTNGLFSSTKLARSNEQRGTQRHTSGAQPVYKQGPSCVPHLARGSGAGRSEHRADERELRKHAPAQNTSNEPLHQETREGFDFGCARLRMHSQPERVEELDLERLHRHAARLYNENEDTGKLLQHRLLAGGWAKAALT